MLTDSLFSDAEAPQRHESLLRINDVARRLKVLGSCIIGCFGEASA